MAYSDAEVAEALIRLAANKYDYQKTADDLSLNIRTLRTWEKRFPKKGVADLLERAIERLLMAIPTDMKGNDWAIALGILMDKWLLVQGKATQRTETIDKTIGEMKDDEYERVLEEAETIIREAQSGSAHSGNGRKPK